MALSDLQGGTIWYVLVRSGTIWYDLVRFCTVLPQFETASRVCLSA